MNATLRLLSFSVASGLIAGVSAPANATLQAFAVVTGGGTGTFFCADNNPLCDTNPATGTMQVNNGTFNGVALNSSLQQSTGTPANPGIDDLNTGSLSIINNTGIKKTVLVEIGDISFSGPVNQFQVTASGSWLDAKGSSVFLQWYVDPANGQGADNGGSTPGFVVDTFANTATVDVLQSFKFDDTVSQSEPGPFSMTLWATITLAPHAELLDRGQAMVATVVPETSTWAMMGLGFAALGYAGLRRTRKPRLI